ncbi:MAG: RNA methyltransferase [Campylobacterales bacterium]|nr:RNA methyltransferase [Campylobacterales bacterium]
MELIEVTTLETPEFALYRTLRDGAVSAKGEFIADSPKVVCMLLKQGVQALSLLATPAFYEQERVLLASLQGVTFFVASREVMEGIVGHKVHHHVMMHGVRPQPAALEALGERILMTLVLSKSENLGVMARSAAALGVSSLVCSSQGAHPYGRRVLRVSMGHVSQLRFHVYDDAVATILALKALGYHVFGAEVTPKATALAQVRVPKRWVLVVGNEGEGLSPEVLAACDTCVQIEMEEGIKSFNVGVAASVLMYQFVYGLKAPE